jgi:hypothetical protein
MPTLEANFGLFGAAANGGGVAFFVHVGGFVFGVIVARLLTSVDESFPRTAPQRCALLPKRAVHGDGSPRRR